MHNSVDAIHGVPYGNHKLVKEFFNHLKNIRPALDLTPSRRNFLFDSPRYENFDSIELDEEMLVEEIDESEAEAEEIVVQDPWANLPLHPYFTDSTYDEFGYQKSDPSYLTLFNPNRACLPLTSARRASGPP